MTSTAHTESTSDGTPLDGMHFHGWDATFACLLTRTPAPRLIHGAVLGIPTDVQPMRFRPRLPSARKHMAFDATHAPTTGTR